MDYSKLIRKIRNELLISQTDLAKLLGVSFASVNRWENKRTQPTLKARRAIREICKEHNIDYETLD